VKAQHRRVVVVLPEASANANSYSCHLGALFVCPLRWSDGVVVASATIIRLLGAG